MIGLEVIFAQTVFNLSNRVLSDSEIKVFEIKNLEFAPIQGKIDEPELRKDFHEFSTRIRSKWNFLNVPSQDFSEVPAFRVISSRKPPKVYPNLKHV